MNAQEWVLHEFWCSPFSSLSAVLGFDVAINCSPCKQAIDISESNVLTLADFEANITVPICICTSESGFLH
jgi:hypothetical protein